MGTEDFNIHHLNTLESCTGTYTFHSLNGKSAIDHVLINNSLLENYLSMHIDEDGTMLNISDHSLVRVWFQLETNRNKPNWKSNKSKTITWISRDEDKLNLCANSFKSMIGKKISFRKCMEKLKITFNSTMKRKTELEREIE